MHEERHIIEYEDENPRCMMTECLIVGLEQEYMLYLCLRTLHTKHMSQVFALRVEDDAPATDKFIQRQR